jgi:hypothetical protein
MFRTGSVFRRLAVGPELLALVKCQILLLLTPPHYGCEMQRIYITLEHVRRCSAVLHCF